MKEFYDNAFDKWSCDMNQLRNEVTNAFDYLFGYKVNVDGETYTIIGMDVNASDPTVHQEVLDMASDIDKGICYNVNVKVDINFLLAKGFDDYLWVSLERLLEVLRDEVDNETHGK